MQKYKVYCPLCETVSSEIYFPDERDMEFFNLNEPICHFCYDMKFAGIIEALDDEATCIAELQDENRRNATRIA